MIVHPKMASDSQITYLDSILNLIDPSTKFFCSAAYFLAGHLEAFCEDMINLFIKYHYSLGTGSSDVNVPNRSLACDPMLASWRMMLDRALET